MNIRSIAASTVLGLGMTLSLSATAWIFPNAPVIGDPLFVLFSTECGRSIADPLRVARVASERHGDEWHVDVTAYITGPTDEICFSPSPPRAHAVPVGPAPMGVRYVYVTMRILKVDPATGDAVEVDASTEAKGLQSTPNETVSGLWLSPAFAGELTHITYAGYVGEDHPTVFVTTQLFDRQGTLTPLTAVGRFNGVEFIGQALTASRPDPDTVDVAPVIAGDLHVAYRGCGRATLRFQSARPEAIESSERSIERVAAPAGIDFCSPPWDVVGVEMVEGDAQ